MSLVEFIVGMILLIVFDCMMVIAAAIWQQTPEGRDGGWLFDRKDPPWKKK